MKMIAKYHAKYDILHAVVCTRSRRTFGNEIFAGVTVFEREDKVITGLTIADFAQRRDELRRLQYPPGVTEYINPILRCPPKVWLVSELKHILFTIENEVCGIYFGDHEFICNFPVLNCNFPVLNAAVCAENKNESLPPENENTNEMEADCERKCNMILAREHAMAFAPNGA